MRTFTLGTFLETFWLGINNLRLHKLRSALTALGIIFGVAAVICMLSISEGASADEMRLIQLMGTQNIIVNSIKPEGSVQSSQENTRMLEYGVTREDFRLIRETIPHVKHVIPMKSIGFGVQFRDRKIAWSVFGTTPEFFETVNVEIERGRALTAEDMLDQKQVCVIGQDLARELFGYEDALGRSIYAESANGFSPYAVVGVLRAVITAGTPARGVDERNLNRESYIPFTTAEANYGDIMVRRASGSREMFKLDYSSLYVNVDDVDHVLPVSQMVERVLEHNHEAHDYEVNVPLARLKLAQKKKANQQLMLGFIAGISLLVGGIGIMNIMLATVTERTREIGVRRALGARQRHITVQFLVETVVLSTGGGLIGIVLGCVAAMTINRLANWETIVEPWTVIISFTLSALVGVFFGMYPAIQAARLDPIEALRHE
ncbi:MAG: FtsX-like permease family protein [Phycisphaerales bacterium]|nr:FtsX-like permease family protein [Phycisphaerales bacterium]